MSERLPDAPSTRTPVSRPIVLLADAVNQLAIQVEALAWGKARVAEIRIRSDGTRVRPGEPGWLYASRTSEVIPPDANEVMRACRQIRESIAELIPE